MNSITIRPQQTAAGCCVSSAAAGLGLARSEDVPERGEAVSGLADYVTVDKGGISRLELFVDGAHCASCIAKIEGALARENGLIESRLNLTSRKLRIVWQGEAERADGMAAVVTGLGYNVMPAEDRDADDEGRREERKLLGALAVSGFAAANVMLLSVSVWSGHFTDMGEATRTLFHWISALIALPAIAWSGRPFFASAWRALRVHQLNMDVPIALAVVLASVMSVAQTAIGGEHAYFDAAITLLFFLLVGRYLDFRMRARARSTAARLAALAPRRAIRVTDNGTTVETRVEDLEPGMLVQVRPGDRIAVDGIVTNGASAIDVSLLTGESAPVSAAEGDRVHAGTINLDGVLTVRIEAVGEATVLSDIARMTDAAESRKTAYVRLADKLAAWYAPVVHLLSAAAFIGWIIAGGDWVWSLTVAITVLIITCPCALGLAVPATQTVAVGRLLSRGVVVKAADGLERLAEIDDIIFDKTGTLTEGTPVLAEAESYSDLDLAIAASLGRNSLHPFSRALAAASDAVVPLENVREEPGFGLEAAFGDGQVRLGSARWCGVSEDGIAGDADSSVWLRRADGEVVRFRFTDRLRADAADSVQRLKASGYRVHLLSGDRAGPVSATAAELGIEDARGSLTPADKQSIVEAMRAEGKRVLMVGDGLNDAPALAAGHASVSPADAADISRTAADAVLQGNRLGGLVELLAVARASRRVAIQNFVLALLYNLVAVPVAVLGFATPLVAAVAMSSSSILVTLNALRLRLVARGL
jgi:Cu2+-exporting ATPase